MLVSHILETAARICPDRPAVWQNEVWKTYGEIELEANVLATYLVNLGLEPGDRVALLLENSSAYVSAHFAVLKAGGVEVSLNTDLTAGSLHHLLGDCDARVLIIAAKFLRRYAELTGCLPALRHVIVEGGLPEERAGHDGVHFHDLSAILRGTSGRVSVRRIDLDLASIVYTSGSTGKPKGVMLSHLNLVSNTRSIVEYLGLVDTDRMLVVLPFHYIYGRSLLYSHFLSCSAVVIDNRFAYPMTVLNTMQRLQATGFAGVPSTFSILLRKTDVKARTFPSLRFVTQAGGGMPATLQTEVAETFHPARVFIMYGSTEAAPRLTFLDPEALPRKRGSIGKAIPNVEVFVAAADGCRTPRGTEGEIAARGSNIMIGYWKDPEGTAEVLRHGLYFTGDLGYEDEEGYLFLTGRARDIMKSGGHRVTAKEIEDTILQIPGVLETAVIAVPDEILGEAIKAFVVPIDSTTNEKAIRNALAARLPSFKLPKFIELRSALPRSESGKVLKCLLREGSNALVPCV